MLEIIFSSVQYLRVVEFEKTDGENSPLWQLQCDSPSFLLALLLLEAIQTHHQVDSWLRSSPQEDSGQREVQQW
jgi:hypothetical protein